MSQEWRQFVMNLESIEADHAEAVLLRHGAQSVTLSDAGDAPVLEPLPGATPLWLETKITALFDAETDLSNLESDLLHSLALTALPPHHFEDLENRVWEREWLKDFVPMKFGQRLWVVPGDDPAPAEYEVVVKLDPGLAFGTGTHPTTALCLEWLDGIDLTDKSVLDFGCGSGILSVAACKLGAKFVEGIDIDSQAVTASQRNALRNSVDGRFIASTSRTDESVQYDVVVANILAGTLVENAASICTWLKPGGLIALSGILETQVDYVQTAFNHVIDFAPPMIQDNWACLSGVRIARTIHESPR